MRLYKFIIPWGEVVQEPDNEDLRWSGVMALAFGETAEEARAVLEQFAAEQGFASSWMRLARVVPFDTDKARVVAWAQV